MFLYPCKAMKRINRFISQTERLVFFLICIISILPVWRFEWFHTGDGAAHLYCGNVLKELISNADSTFHHFFFVNLQPVPNMVIQVVIAMLLFVFSAVLTNKIIMPSNSVLARRMFQLHMNYPNGFLKIQRIRHDDLYVQNIL